MPFLKHVDKYIIRKFVSTYLFTMFIFILIGILIDLSEKVNYFVEEKVGPGEIIEDYYLNFMVWLVVMLSPLFILIAVIYFTSRLADQSEIIAMRNAGMSFSQLYKPYLITSVLVAAVMLVTNHYILPIAQKGKIDFENRYIKKNKALKTLENLHLYTQPNQVVSARSYRLADSVARDLIIEELEGNQLKQYLKATSARWKNDEGKWQLNNYEIRKINGLNEELVLGRGQRLDTLINLLPSDFVDSRDEEATLTTPQLLKKIKRDYQRGLSTSREYEMEYHRRTADPFTIIILTLIGFAISSRKVRGGIGIHLTIGISLGALYIFISRFSQTSAASSAVPLVLGVWVPNIIFGFIAMLLARFAQK
ncbi:MAG: LptF/LptG family permease [Bacteroidia bacterium]|nr:LptF/LptG family permease [Bacteroidia bacterium]